MKQLRKKLEEYEARQEKYAFIHPDRWGVAQKDNAYKKNAYKKAVLERVLRDRRIETWTISREMAATYEQNFDCDIFNNACGVIKDYCETGGQKVRRGTGLPAAE